jgi:hypothetical protein
VLAAAERYVAAYEFPRTSAARLRAMLVMRSVPRKVPRGEGHDAAKGKGWESSYPITLSSAAPSLGTSAVAGPETVGEEARPVPRGAACR